MYDGQFHEGRRSLQAQHLGQRLRCLLLRIPLSGRPLRLCSSPCIDERNPSQIRPVQLYSEQTVEIQNVTFKDQADYGCDEGTLRRRGSRLRHAGIRLP